jgi:hypothetical protein
VRETVDSLITRELSKKYPWSFGAVCLLLLRCRVLREIAENFEVLW